MWIESHKGDWANTDQLAAIQLGGIALWGSAPNAKGNAWTILGTFQSPEEAKIALGNIMRAMNTGEYEALEYDEWSDTEEM